MQWRKFFLCEQVLLLIKGPIKLKIVYAPKTSAKDIMGPYSALLVTHPKYIIEIDQLQ